jgi:hypothetical protein
MAISASGMKTKKQAIASTNALPGALFVYLRFLCIAHHSFKKRLLSTGRLPEMEKVIGAPNPGTWVKKGIFNNGLKVAVVVTETNQKSIVWLLPTGCHGTGI